MNNWHTKLEEKSQAYRDWHSSNISQLIHWTVFLATLITLFLVISASIDGSAFTEEGVDTTPTVLSEQLIETNEVLVKFSSDKEKRGKALGIVNGKASTKAEYNRLKEKLGIEVIEIDKKAKASEVANSLKSQEGVEFAEPNYLVPEAAVPNDPLTIEGITKTDANGNGVIETAGWHLGVVNGPAAWDVHKGSEEVIIAVIDSGIDSTHPDLAAKIVPGWNFYDNNADTTDVKGHGTGVAGLAVASSDNSTGVASMCWNCKLMPVRASSSTGWASYATLATSIVYAADNGARVANLSFARMNDRADINAAADYMISKGGVVVVGSGNSDVEEVSLAQDNPRIIVAASTNINDVRSSWSTYGAGVDVSAPGETVKTTMRNGIYGSGSGTSFSSPMVAGMAGMIISANPNLTPTQITGIIKSSVDDLGTPGFDKYYGHGRINLCKAIATATGTTASCGGGSVPPADTTPPTTTITSPVNGATVSDMVTIAANASDNVGVAKVEFYIDNVLKGSDSSSPFTYAWNTALSANGSHTLKTIAYDTSFNSGSSAVVTVSVNNAADTTPPAVSVTSPNDGGTISNFITFKGTGSDAESGVKTIDLFVDGALIKHCDQLTECSTTFDSTGWPNGSHEFSAKATDNVGNIGSSKVTATISNGDSNSGGIDSTPPTLSNISPADGSSIGDNGKTQLKATATDDVKMKQVSIKVNGLTSKTCNGSKAALSCTYSLDNRSQPSGQILVEFLALDAAGNTATKQILLNKQ